MRKLALVLILSALAPVAASAASLSVMLDQAVRLTLATPASDVIVGNPAIADVSVADQRHLVITGKSFGVTNLMVIGAGGRLVYNRQIVVGAPQENRVSIFRGADSETYACAPACIRTSAATSPAAAGGGAAAPSMAAPSGDPGNIRASPTTP